MRELVAWLEAREKNRVLLFRRAASSPGPLRARLLSAALLTRCGPHGTAGYVRFSAGGAGPPSRLSTDGNLQRTFDSVDWTKWKTDDDGMLGCIVSTWAPAP